MIAGSEHTKATFSLVRDLTDRPAYYSAALSALRRFAGDDTVDPALIDKDYIGRFLDHLRLKGKSQHTVTAYFRAIRAIYNSDTASGIVPPCKAFDETADTMPAPRPVMSSADLRKLARHDFGTMTSFARARDIFMFSFHALAMPFDDIAHLTRADIRGSRLITPRRHIVWLPQLEEISRRHRSQSDDRLMPPAIAGEESRWADTMSKIGRMLSLSTDPSRISLDDTWRIEATRFGLENDSTDIVAMRLSADITRTATHWYALINNTFDSLDHIAQIIGDRAVTFMPRLCRMKRTPLGLKKEEDPVLRRIMFVRAGDTTVDSLQKSFATAATFMFHISDGRRRFSVIPDYEMHMFRLAVDGGADCVSDNSHADSFVAGQRVRVVAHPLLDGLEGYVVSPGDNVNISVRLDSLNINIITPSIHRDFLKTI